jgi:very-short-patch-repair endonuclease
MCCPSSEWSSNNFAPRHSLLPLQGEGWDGDGSCMKGQTNKKLLQNRMQRNLRRNMTDAESRLWRCLRSKQMGGFKFRRQHPFDNYVLDFVSLEAMLVVEVDGRQHLANKAADEARTRILSKAGFKVLRFWNNEVLTQTDAVKETIWRALNTPSPPRSSP